LAEASILALGADQNNIFRLVVMRAMRFSLAGVALGIAGALAVAGSSAACCSAWRHPTPRRLHRALSYWFSSHS